MNAPDRNPSEGRTRQAESHEPEGCTRPAGSCEPCDQRAEALHVQMAHDDARHENSPSTWG